MTMNIKPNETVQITHYGRDHKKRNIFPNSQSVREMLLSMPGNL